MNAGGLAVAALVVVGLLGTVAAAFGIIPGLQVAPSLAAWTSLAAEPGIWQSIWLSSLSAAVGLGLGLGLAVAVAAWLPPARAALAIASLTVLLAIPHGTVALGLGQAAAPTGMVASLLAPIAGWSTPPSWLLPQDPWALTLGIAIALKEAPFLLLAILAASSTLPVERLVDQAQSLGRDRGGAWCAAVLPLVWPQLRWPLFAAAGYAVAALDMASVLAPTAPPPLALVAVQAFLDPDPARIAVGSAAALGVGLLALALWVVVLVAAPLIARVCHRVPAALAIAGGGGVAVLTLLTLFVLVLWSLSWVWRFPNPLPSAWSVYGWQVAARDAPIGTTLGVAAVVAVFAVVLAVAALRRGRGYLMVIGLMVPEIALLPGLHLTLVFANLDGTAFAVVASHLVFALPYAWLVLVGPWMALDPRPERVAQSLGAGPWRRFWRIRLPRLARPLALALAVAFAVSVGQYATTLVAGAGSWRTLTTDAVALAGGGDRRVTAAIGLLSAALPLAAFALALSLTQRRRGQGRSA